MRPRIGIIGGGRMGTTHGKAAHFLIKQGLIDADLVAVAEADNARRESFARAAGVVLVTAEPDELIGSPDVNTVYICTPTFNHRVLAEKVCAAGKALFCEKPLAFNAADAAAMSVAAKAAGVTHQVGLVMRFSAVMNVTRSLINDPDFGRPMTATLIDDQFFPIQGHYASTWRADAAQVGAGTLLEHAIHDIDLLVSFFGRVKRVHGATRNFAGKAGVEDLSSAMLEFESGAVATHVSIWHNILHRGSSRRIMVTSENAQFGWDDDDWAAPIRVDAQRDGGRTRISSDEVVARHISLAGIADERLRAIMTPRYGGQDYALEDYMFLKAVSEDRPASPNFEVAVYAHRIVDAIYESAREGRPVDIADAKLPLSAGGEGAGG
jgi:myo-inositol 2-dehydrogenase / D-chiro-inositol 1-dehydrogenase